MASCKLILLFGCITIGYCLKILVVYPLPTRTHTILGDGIVRNLLNAGHEVTYITALPGVTAPKLRRVVVDSTAIPEKVLNVSCLMRKEVVMDYDYAFNMMVNITSLTLEHEEVRRLMNDPREQFDLVIAEWLFNEVYSGFSAVFNCPYIWSFPFEPNFSTLSLIDEATNPAYMTHVVFNYTPPFTFMQRIETLWLQIVATTVSTFYYNNIEKALYEKVFHGVVARKGRELPPYDDIRHNASMALGNTHVSFGTNIRLPINFKSIGGYHVDTDVKPLDEDLKKIMDQSEHGVIYFSMGSNAKSKDFPDEIKKSFINMFRTLKQTVIWKYEEPLANLPKNVHVLKWAPQTSILAHPKCLVFITQGGLVSTTEAVHFAVPIIGIPVFFDQHNNIDRAVERGYAKKVMLSDNVGNDVKIVLEEILGNPRYKQNMKEVSFIYHHRPVSPGKELVHWVEHVIATRGAVHLRSPALRTPWYQKVYLDVLAVVVLMVFIVKRLITLAIARRHKLLKEKCS